MKTICNGSATTMGCFIGTAALALTSSCAHHPSPAEEGINAPMAPPSELAIAIVPQTGAEMRAPDVCTSIADPGTVRRSAIVSVVDRGLGAWLQGVNIKAQVSKGKFGGWKIQTLHLANPCYASVDLRPGDVVTAVNGSSVAREVKAFDVFTALKTASVIEVDYLRDGKPAQLRFDIVD